MAGIASGLEIAGKFIRENVDNLPKAVELITERKLNVDHELKELRSRKERNDYLEGMSAGFGAALEALKQIQTKQKETAQESPVVPHSQFSLLITKGAL
jgi:hypothetical protein